MEKMSYVLGYEYEKKLQNLYHGSVSGGKIKLADDLWKRIDKKKHASHKTQMETITN